MTTTINKQIITMIDDNNKLFYKVWNNIYLKTKIFSFLNSRLKLLPKYHGDKYINKSNVMDNNNLKKKYFKYSEINNVNKMAIYNKELLRYKVSRNEVLHFSVNPGLAIFSRFKENNLSTIEFYKQLFKNYSIYFIGNSTVIKNTIDSIIDMDCLIAFTILIEGNIIKNDKLKLHYENSILSGSIEICKFISNKFNLKLNNDEISQLIKRIGKIEDDQESEGEMGLSSNLIGNFGIIDDQEFSDDDDYEEYHDENDNSEIKLNKLIYSREYLLKEFGFHCNSVFGVKNIKSLNYLSGMYHFKKPINQKKRSLNENESFVKKPKILKRMQDFISPTLISNSYMEMTLQHILDYCYAACLLLELNEISLFESKSILKYLDSNPQRLILSKSTLDEISQLLNTGNNFKLLKLLVKEIPVVTNSNEIQHIKKLLKMVILFHFTQDPNITFYNAKFENNFKFIPSLKINSSYFALASGKFNIILNYWFKSDDIERRSKEIFDFCRNDNTTQILFIQDFIKSLKEDNDDEYNSNFSDNGGEMDDFISDIGFKHSLFHLLISFDNFEILELFVNSLNQVDQSFLKNIKKEYIYIKSIKVFDLFYNNKYLKQYFNFKLLLKYANSTLPSITGIQQLPNSNTNTSLILNHFKLNYQVDYQLCINQLSINKIEKYYLNDFIYSNYQDFKNNIFINNIIEHNNPLLPTTKQNNFIRLSNLTLEKFILIYNQVILPLKQDYYCPNNIEIISWIFQNHLDDIKNHKFKFHFIKSHTILYCIYLNNTLPTKYRNYLKDSNLLLWIKEICQNSKILKSIIKYNHFIEFKILFKYFNSDKSDGIKNNVLFLQIKSNILKFILKYNNINFLKFIYKYDNLYYNNSIYKFNNYNYNSILYSIDVVNYLIDKFKFKPLSK